MAKIVKSNKAPEGELDIAVGNVSFKVGDGAPYETDDLAILGVAADSEWLDILYEDGETSADAKSAARAERDDNKFLQKTRAQVNKQRAEKDPVEPALPMPETVEEAKEIVESEKGDNS